MRQKTNLLAKNNVPEGVLSEIPYQPNLYNYIEGGDVLSHVMSADYLSNRQKDYLHQYYINNLTYRETGRYYGVSYETVRTEIHRAIDLVKEHYDAV
jgi:DNA-directed RNA polymerase specialized sigma24 family protein